jgi:hypothetical protein
MDFSEALEESLKSMSSDQKVRGVVMGINPTEKQVDIGRNTPDMFLLTSTVLIPMLIPKRN